MEFLFDLILGIFNFGLDIIMFIIRLICALIVAGIAVYKHRSGFFFGLVGFWFPWLVIIMPFIPQKMPRLPAHIRELEAFKDKNSVIASVMALSAIVAKADGNVTREEISLIKDFLTRQFNISRQELDRYADTFEYGKNHPEEYIVFTNLLKTYYRNVAMYRALAYLFIGIIMEGETVSSEAEAQVRKILVEFGISEYEYQSIKHAFSGGYSYQQGYEQSYQNGYGGYSQGASQSALIKKYSQVLGVSEDASLAEIKKAYRKLAKEHHPDKFASEGMPEQYVEFANQKIAEINEAYEYLKDMKEK